MDCDLREIDLTGGSFTSEKGKGKVVLDYFNKVFGQQRTRTLRTEENVTRVVTDDQNNKLAAELSFDEFTKAVKHIHPDTFIYLFIFSFLARGQI